MLVFAVPAVGQRSTQPADAPQLSESASSSASRVQPAKPPRGLEADVYAVYRAYVAYGDKAALAQAHRQSSRTSASRLCVVVEASAAGEAAARDSLAALDARIDTSYGSLIRAFVPIANLKRLAGAPGVELVRLPMTPRSQAVSQGVVEIGASAWQAEGWTGSGVKVGIVDIGFDGYVDLLGTELPAAEGVVAWGGSGLPENGGDIHGAAVAEIVHDVAPGAKLYLARVEDEVDLGNAVDWLLAQGVDVISMSLSWPGAGIGDGGGEINDVVTAAVAGGVFWANAAGNQRLGHWMGDFDASTIKTADGYRYHEFEPGSDAIGNTFLCLAGDEIYGVLSWRDSWGGATQDYDLELRRWDAAGSAWETVTISANYQAGESADKPYEVIATRASKAGLYAFSIVRYAASKTAVSFDLTLFCHDLDDPSNLSPHWYSHARSLAIPADNAAAGFVAVGAVGRPSAYALEAYSSEGPTRDGRLAPEIAAPSSVLSTVYGVFAGTSASAPHVAGAAALVIESMSAVGPAQVESYLRTNAVDLGSAGDDTQYGSGRLLLPSPPVDTRQPWEVTLNLSATEVAAGETVTYTGTVESAAGVPGSGAVVIQKRRAGSETWGTWRKPSLGADGSYAISVAMTTADRQWVRVAAAQSGTPDHLDGGCAPGRSPPSRRRPPGDGDHRQ
ncbi:MAG: S8 family serine peptidase [Thermoleophilia bacterium]